VSSSLISSTR